MQCFAIDWTAKGNAASTPDLLADEPNSAQQLDIIIIVLSARA